MKNSQIAVTISFINKDKDIVKTRNIYKEELEKIKFGTKFKILLDETDTDGDNFVNEVATYIGKGAIMITKYGKENGNIIEKVGLRKINS